ncbi:MAG: type I-E CRISPR-associated protein Cas7/Cse4/CasC [Nitrospiraceae bacterium]|nr:type I-E CRISPR-associated protein Cas7/Cse4/CasC [Nitrospiraceae bacterium]
MLIEIHVIQNHSPANLNRDDLGAPKTCYFGGVLRSRISSQCLKRSIRMSDEFKQLLGGVRTRQLAKLIAQKVTGKDVRKRAEDILKMCGFKPKESKKGTTEDVDKSKMLVYVSKEAIEEMAMLLQSSDGKNDDKLAREFAKLIAERTVVPDIALSGRMLEPDKSSATTWKELNTTVEAALQVAHAISTHEARPEVDYYVAADDISGEDAGAGYVDEAMFASACLYKYFSIHWETLVNNLKGYGDNHEKLAAHTVGAFIRGAALVNPGERVNGRAAGKQNSFAAHNPPDGILVEIRNAPINYANAFAKPATHDIRDIVSQSVAQLGQYAYDMDTGYGMPTNRFWFSPNYRYPLTFITKEKENDKEKQKEIDLSDINIKSLDELIPAIIKEIGHDWEEVKNIVINPEAS